MSARAPGAIEQLFTAIHSHIPDAELGGIVGDVNHSFGYHLARRDLPGDDYSVVLTLDRKGASDCASALDVTFGSGSPWMKTCTQRLLTAAKAHDPRLRALREFCGTLDYSNTYPWDLSVGRSEGLNSWDSSHLWHIHLSFYRAFADDWAALAPIVDVFCGIAPPKPKPPTPPAPKPHSEENDMYIQFADDKSHPGLSDAATYQVTGGFLLWLTGSDWAAVGKPAHFVVPHATSHYYRMPIVPGTPDPRKGEQG